MNSARGQVKPMRLPQFRLQDLMFLVLVSALLIAAGIEMSKSEPTMIQEMLMQILVLGSLILLVALWVSLLLVMFARFFRGEVEPKPLARTEHGRHSS